MNLTIGEFKKIFPDNNITLSDGLVIAGINRDSRAVKPGEIYVAIKGVRFDGHDFLKQAFENGAVAALVDADDLDFENLAKVKDVVLGMGALAKAYRKKFKQPLIAITGSSGKTTTKELLAHVLSGDGEVVATEGNLNNHIGVPVTMFRFHDAAKYFIVEMGMSHLEEIRYLAKMAAPSCAVVSSIGRAHLEGVGGGIENVAKAKGELFEELSKDALAFVYEDDEWIRTMETQAGKISYGSSENVDYKLFDVSFGESASQFVVENKGQRHDVKINMVGHHHVQNALAVFAIASELGLKAKVIVDRLDSFAMTINRGRVLKINGMTIVDDSYNANPDSMKLSLEAFNEEYDSCFKMAVLGDMLELGTDAEACHRELGEYCKTQSIDVLLTYGDFGADYLVGFDDSSRGFEFSDHGLLAGKLMEVAGKQDGKVAVLLKGSRGSRMENILEQLKG